jgi:transposase
MIGWRAGSRTAPGRRSSRDCLPKPTPTASWNGCGRRWTVRRCGRISTLLALGSNRRSAAGAKKGGAKPVAGEALGRSRGGLTPKVHLAAEGKGRPLAVLLSEGQRHDSTQLEPVLDRIRVPRQSRSGAPKRGRPRKRPHRLLADKGYSYPRCRRALRRRGIPSMIPERKDQREQRRKRGSRGGRPCRFSREEYGQRSWIERLINRLKHWRRIATRYEKRAENYQAFVLFGCILLWL